MIIELDIEIPSKVELIEKNEVPSTPPINKMKDSALQARILAALSSIR